VLVTCAVCGAPFTPTRIQRGLSEKRHCAIRCAEHRLPHRGVHAQAGNEICAGCARTFTASAGARGRWQRFFCSRACYRRTNTIEGNQRAARRQVLTSTQFDRIRDEARSTVVVLYDRDLGFGRVPANLVHHLTLDGAEAPPAPSLNQES